MTIKVIIGDEHPLFLKGVNDFLSSAPDIAVVGVCKTDDQALAMMRELEPAVAILDVNMFDLGGAALLEAAREKTSTKILFLAAHARVRDIVAATAEGAYGFLRKDCEPAELLHATREIAAGRKPLPVELFESLQGTTRRGHYGPKQVLLTNREWKVMALAAEGLSNKEIGRKLNMTTGTTKIHLHHIFRKFGIKSRTALAHLALRHSAKKGSLREGN